MEQDFINKISDLQPSKHIFGSQRGSEENAKIKFVIPLLEYLGYDSVENLFFETLNIDIMIRIEGECLLIVECKAWAEFWSTIRTNI